MPYKYIGRTLDHKGKTLWEIVGNLKNFGIGRLVVRNMFERYPEPSYLRILKVVAMTNPEKPSMDEPRNVRVWVERTFRGKKYPEPYYIKAASFKADYKLIPRDEEEAYMKGSNPRPVKLMPKMIELPPLLKELVIRENIINGDPPEKDNEVEAVYATNVNNNFRVVKDGEKPDVEVTMGLGKPISPGLYEGTGLEFNK
ncbi:hypothetical protein HHI36_020386 [Cryptolaemus montrouzieri]|uniref:Mitochondrial ribosomal protein S34 n=1 Tax=Cryptolaemus montrouzieri TaxID=559131 RepID=A0ABD2NAJ3_9CUCU